MRKAHAVIVLAACLTGGSAWAQPAGYTIVDLGPGNANCSYGDLINASGQGLIQAQGSGGYDPFLVDANGTRIDLGSLFGFGATARQINAAGQVIGLASADQTNQTYHPFLWSASTGMIDLTPPGGSSAAACAINNRGDVVGGYVASRTAHSYLYTGGQFYNLDSLPIAGLSNWTSLDLATSINDAGVIFGRGTIGGQTHGYMLLPAAQNLLTEGGFEGYVPPSLGPPGWVSDPIRQIPAKSETNQPHSGSQNGACWATTSQDCGMYQEVQATATGTYTLTVYANADRTGGFIGANVNGQLARSASVDVRGFGNYGAAYVLTFSASANDTIRVWMYSPATPGYVVIDDVSLTLQSQP